jgi:DNA primase small subunit
MILIVLREATPEERKIFYCEEWSKKDLPDFILHTLSLREFGFDLDGSGPSHRYNQFLTVEQLADFLRSKAPYGAYSSVALYEHPSLRKGWLKSELVFDVDAKDLPLKRCKCRAGEICEICIDDARGVVAQFVETLRSDLGLREVNTVYSGRGFHIRVTDDAVMKLEGAERGQLVEYITGSVIPTDITLAFGYSRIFRERAARALDRIDEKKIEEAGLRRALAQKLVAEKEKVVAMMRSGKIGEVERIEGMGPKSFRIFLEMLAKINSELTDGKVTIDTKRILRLPSSLHSGVSRKCVLVHDIDRFSPDDAIPKFLRESAYG